jgi:hypothetical protein
VAAHSRLLEGAIRRDVQCLKFWKKSGDEALTNLQRNSNDDLIKTAAGPNCLPATETVTTPTTVYLMEGILAIRSYRNTRGFQDLTEKPLDSSIIIWHRRMAGTSI